MTVSTLTKVSLTGGDIKQIKAALKGHKRNKYNDILNHVKFEVKNGLLNITYADFDKTIITLNFTTESDNISFLFPIDVLKKLSVNKNTLHEFIASDNFNSVNHIENGISQTHSTPDPSDFPSNPYEGKEFNKVVTLGHNMIQKLNLATISTSNSASRPVLTGVLLRNDKIYSTDSHRLYATDSGLTLDKDILLPAQLVEKVKALTGKIDIVEMFVSGELIKLSNMSFSIYYDGFLGNFPDVSRLLPLDFNLTFDIVEFDKFKKTLEVIKKMGNERNATTFTIKDNVLILSSHKQGEESKITTNINVHISDWRGEKEMTFTCDASYVLDGLKQVEGKSIRFNMVSHLRPFTITDQHTTDGTLALILPIRINH